MKLLPFEKLTYKTKLKEDVALKRLKENINSTKNFNVSKPYEGKIEGKTFAIKRVISYRNSFLPRISGLVEKDYDGTLLKVKMKLPVPVIVFLCLWCLAVGFGGAAVVIHALRGPGFTKDAFGPVLMLIGVYALNMGGFKYESNKSKKDFERILEAEKI